VKQIDLIVCFHNAEKVLIDVLRDLVELSAVLPRLSFILVNNDSSDSTGEVLSRISEAYPSMTYVEVKNSNGYGDGVKAGMRVARQSAEFVGVSHGNLKFSINSFFDSLFDVYTPGKEAYFTTRVGRSLKECLLSYSLRIVASFRYLHLFPDCVGAVRLVDQRVLGSIDIERGPNNYTFDLWLFINVLKIGSPISSLKLVERRFLEHYSSWSRGPVSTGKMIFSYMKTIFSGSE
jgi:glycosyltransferase involved in cell wall biosynthesis